MDISQKELSKKDLLKTTGISYGQLYRWKREGLIPEEWFVKRPSPTGQETFFPKEQILKRVQASQTLKDRYSLEELAKLLSPEITNRVFTEEELECFTEIDIRVAADFMDVLNKDTFTFIEVLVMITLCRWKKQNLILEQELYDLIPNVATTAANITEIKTFFLLLAVNEAHYGLFLLNPSPEGGATSMEAAPSRPISSSTVNTAASRGWGRSSASSRARAIAIAIPSSCLLYTSHGHCQDKSKLLLHHY